MNELKIERGEHFLWCACPKIVTNSILETIGLELGNEPPSLILDLLNTSDIEDSSLPDLKEICERVLSVPKSLIFVSIDPELNAVLDQYWNLVPTVQEALDFLEMEEIERSLGF
jgi:hypothetical protein